MNLLPAKSDWYSDYFLGSDHLDIYKDDNGAYKITPLLAAEVLLPLVLQYYRYESESKIWYKFNGTQFVVSKHLFTDVKDSLNDMRARCQTNKQYFGSFNGIHGNQFMPKIIEILQQSYILHLPIDQFDVDPDILNTPDGVNALLSGERFPNNQSYLCRQMTSVAPEDDQNGLMCPNYIKHLEFMTNGDKRLQEYIELISGYILTGYTFQQEFYWFYGTQNNGKSSLVNIWQHVLGSYAWTAPNDMFALNYYQVHNEQLMRLAGKRFILTEELKGNKWDEAKIKAVMSGSSIAAAEKGGKHVNFRPICKLVFTSNHKPDVNANDGGIVRRLRLTAFTKQITPDMRIKDFETNCLQPEAPFILNRMIKHAQKVLQSKNIETPNYVALETQQYFKGHNLVEQFMEDACETSPAVSCSNKQLLDGYNAWAREQGYDDITSRSLGSKLEQLGFKSINTGGIRGRGGIQLNETYRSKLRFI